MAAAACSMLPCMRYISKGSCRLRSYDIAAAVPKATPQCLCCLWQAILAPSACPHMYDVEPIINQLLQY